jgi:hypothetical protein
MEDGRLRGDLAMTRGGKTGESRWRCLPERTGGRWWSGQDARERPFIGVLA